MPQRRRPNLLVRMLTTRQAVLNNPGCARVLLPSPRKFALHASISSSALSSWAMHSVALEAHASAEMCRLAYELPGPS